MTHTHAPAAPPTRPGRRVRARAAVVAALLGTALTGCAALSNPVAEGIPVRRLPPELLGHSRNELVTIPLTALQQTPPQVYRLDAGDVLGVYIQGTFLGGERTVPGVAPSGPPVRFSETGLQPPSLGYPIAVRKDGALTLPLIKPIPVRGLTVEEAQEAISRAYIEAKILQPGGERTLVTLVRKRTYRVQVLRQELGGFNTGPEGVVGVSFISQTTKRGTGHLIDLPAGENDVMNALTRTGGLPGLDAGEEVIIFRGPSEADRALLDGGSQKKKPQFEAVYVGVSCPVARIPLRVKPGSPPPPDQVVLHDGDVVYIPYRDLERFYTGGLLPAGEYPLSQDRDLDVVQALSLVHGPFINGSLIVAGGGNPVSDDQLAPSNLGVFPAVAPGLGAPSPSLLTVLRRTPWGGTVPIRVDLYRALRDPRERILVQPQDVLILQETPEEALARYIDEHFSLNFTYLWSHSRSATGTIAGTVPQP
jgi:hypothetical protein